MLGLTTFATAVLALVIALLPGTASAQEADTLTISSTFNMDWLYEPVGPDLAEVFANGHEHTWTLTLHGTSHSHYLFSSIYYATEIHATSFDLEFFGPDAATLNSIVSDHIAGGDVWIYLENAYTSAFGNDFAVMHVWAAGPDMSFYSGHDMGVFTLFPTDADGYPVVGPDPFSIWADYSELTDMRPGNNGAIQSPASLVTIEGSMGELEPGAPVVLGVADAAVFEGSRGASNVAVPVTLSSGSSQAITVHYSTANGTAVAPNPGTGSFSAVVPLEFGVNLLTVKALDGAGNAAHFSTSVMYAPELWGRPRSRRRDWYCTQRSQERSQSATTSHLRSIEKSGS